MRARIAAFLAGVLVVLGGYSWAAQTGGFPARPRFQAVTVTGAVSAGSASVTGAVSAGSAAVTGNVTAARATFTGGASSSVLSLLLESGLPIAVWNETDAAADNRRWGFFASSGGFAGSVWNDALTLSNEWVRVERSGASVASVNLQGASVQANGSPVCTAAGTGCGSKISAASVTGGGSSCSVGSNRVNIDAGCTRNSQGSYTITITNDYAAGPVCMVRTLPIGFAAFATKSTSTLTVNTYNTAGSLVDESFEVMCVGA